MEQRLSEWPQVTNKQQQQQQKLLSSSSSSLRQTDITTSSQVIYNKQQQQHEHEHDQQQNQANSCINIEGEKTTKLRINTLEGQVEEQRQLRLHDARQVEVKAAKIKEWVNNKLRELEEQNQLLREQNIKCNQQLELLRNHIATHNPLLRSTNTTTTAGTSNSVRNSLSLEVPSELVELERRHSANLTNSNSREKNLLAMESQELERNLMAAVDDLALTPLTNISNMNSMTINQAKLSQRETSSSDTDTAHDYAEIYTPSCEKLPAWLKGNLTTPVATTTTTGTLGDGNSSATTTTLSEMIVGPPRPPTPPLHRFPSWEAKIYQVANDGLTTSTTDDEKQQQQHPPSSSGHNTLDSSHSRYANVTAANTGTMSSKNSEFVNEDVGVTTPNTPQLSTRQQQTASGGFCDISVPVYATVKGRASQIRSVPFTGDSSDDSSDGEDHAVMLTQNSHNSTSTDNTETSTSGSASSPSKSLKTSSSLSPAKRSDSESPKVNNNTNTNNNTNNNNKPRVLSEDYALPPDAVSESSCMDASLPSLLMRQSYVDSPSKKLESLEKAGHLAKLGGKLKTWRKRWFVLKNGTLCYWKTQQDVGRKPQGVIMLDDACRINRAEGAATFEIDTGTKVYYLTADSHVHMDDWIRVLQNVQRRNATKLLLSTRDDKKSTVEGWLTKVKNGHGKKCYCVLLGKMFLYFKTPNDTNPLGQINMRDARVEEVEHASDSDSEESEDISHSQAHLTIAIYPAHQGPTYLILPNKQERDNWLYHLTVVSGGGPSAGTQYEQLVQKLMETNGDPNCVVWRHPILLHTKETISSPLTSLHSEVIQAEAIKLFKSIQLFLSVAINQPGVDYHVVLAQNALQHCLDVPELQTEMICILVKQTSRHSGQKLSVGVQVNKKLGKQTRTTIPAPIIDCKSNPPAYTFIQGWQLLSLAISLFVPKSSRLLWYLKVHLSRNADTKTDTGKYAAYCERALERTLKNGGRETKPSRMEVLSILMKNPYHHSLPHAIPVHMMNSTYQVVSFDGSTIIEEFQCTLAHEIGTRNNTNGFCLFSDDPIEKDLEHYLDPMAKLGDVISKWETALREKGSGKFENTRVIQLSYKNRLYWKNSVKFETDKERLLLCYQTNAQIVQGRFPLSRDLAIELASLMSQIDMGDYSHEKSRSNGGNAGIRAIDNFYPYRYRDAYNAEQLKELQELLLSKWMLLRGRSTLDCVRIYLTCCRKWSFFGATLFQAKPRHSDQAMAWLAVSEDALNVLELSSMAPMAHYPYGSVITFGGCQEDFMLVVSNEMAAVGSQIEEQKLLFAMSKPKIFEITLLIADYMNALGHTVPGTPQMTTLTRNGSHRSLRSQRPGISGDRSNTFGTNTNCMFTNATTTAHNTLNSHATHTLNSQHTNTLNSSHYNTAAAAGAAASSSGNNSNYASGHNTLNSVHGHDNHQHHHNNNNNNTLQQQTHQPDILKSTPDHQRIK